MAGTGRGSRSGRARSLLKNYSLFPAGAESIRRRPENVRRVRERESCSSTQAHRASAHCILLSVQLGKNREVLRRRKGEPAAARDVGTWTHGGPAPAARPRPGGKTPPPGTLLRGFFSPAGYGGCSRHFSIRTFTSSGPAKQAPELSLLPAAIKKPPKLD